MDARTLHPTSGGDAGRPVPLGDYLLSPHFDRHTTADVYDATHTPTGGARRVYVLRPGAMRNNPLVHQVVCEADAARWLRHPTTAKVEAQGDTPSRRLYVAVEQPTGRSLGDLLAESGALAPWRVVRLAGRLVEALDEAHMVGLVHGRLTPATVVLAPNTSHAGGAPGPTAVVLTGLGTAALDGGVATADADRPYVSPEQLAGRQPDARSDVFGLASLLHHALTGGAPRECGPDSPAAAPGAVAVEGVLAAARSADPRRRPATVKAFWDDLLEALVADAVRAAARGAGGAVALPAAPLDEGAALAHLELAEVAPTPLPAASPPPSEPVRAPAMPFGGLDLAAASPQPPAPRRPVQPRWAKPAARDAAPAPHPSRATRATPRTTRRAVRIVLVSALAAPVVAAALSRWRSDVAARGAEGTVASGTAPTTAGAWRRLTAAPMLAPVTPRPVVPAGPAAGAWARTPARRDADVSGVADEGVGPATPRIDLPAVELPAAPAAPTAQRALVRPEEFTTRLKLSGTP